MSGRCLPLLAPGHHARIRQITRSKHGEGVHRYQLLLDNQDILTSRETKDMGKRIKVKNKKLPDAPWLLPKRASGLRRLNRPAPRSLACGDSPAVLTREQCPIPTA